MEQVIDGGVPPAIPDLDIDPRYGTWDTHIIQSKLLLTHSVQDGNVNSIYYFPVAYPSLMVHEDKLKELSDALFWLPVSLKTSVENINCQRDVKLTSADSTPLPINEIGIYFYDGTGNMLIGDSLFPYAEPTHHDDMVKIIEQSRKKKRSELMCCELLTNNYPNFGKDMTMAPSYVSLRDPNFKEKNNESETIFFQSIWTSDVGLRIHIQALLAPPTRTEARLYYKKDGASWKLQPKSRTFKYVTVAPFDYRRGFMTNPPGNDRLLSAHAARIKASNFCESRTQATASLTGDAVTVARYNTQFGKFDDYENNFTRVITPYQPDDWLCHKWRSPDSLQAVLGKEGKTIWGKQTCSSYFNNTTPFSGNKNIKPFFMKFGPSYNGLNFQPYYCHFELNYIMEVKVYRAQAFLERPVFPPTNPATKTNYDAEELRHCADMTYMQVKMYNQYATKDSTGVYYNDIPNTFNRQFIPHFQEMAIEFKETA